MLYATGQQEREDEAVCEEMTHSLPVQYVLASLASDVTTPRISCGWPVLPRGFPLAHRAGSASRKSDVIL